MSEDLQLYSNAGCPYAQRTRIALLEKNVEFKFVEIDLSNKPDWFLAVSPTGKVPVMVHDNNHFYESTIINEYIDETWPDPPLMPMNAGLRAQARIWIDKFSVFAAALFHIGIDRDVQVNSEILQQELAEIEKGFSEFSADGPYWFGSAVSLVDISFYTFFERMPMVEKKLNTRLESYPRCYHWFQIMSSRDSVIFTSRTAEQHIESFERLAKRLAAV